MRRRWMIAWIGAAAIGVTNGILREATYGKRVDERSANQYNLAEGRAWSVVLAWLATGPAVVNRLQRGSGRT